MTLKLVIAALFIASSVNAASAGFTPKKREEIPPDATYSGFADITEENLRTIPGFEGSRGEFSEKMHPLSNEAVYYQVVKEPLQGMVYFLVHGPKGGALWSLCSNAGEDPLHGERLVLATPTGMKHLVMRCAYGGKSYDIAHLYARPSSFPVFSKRGDTTVDLDKELLDVVGIEDAACREEIRKKMQETWDGLPDFPDYQKRRRCRFCLQDGTFGDDIMKNEPKYWIIVASRDHAMRGVNGSFCQACHGKRGPMEKMSEGDWVVIYSPREEFERDEKCQKFTAIGRVKDDDIYQVEMYAGFVPFRRNITFYPCTEILIAPMLNYLSFTVGKVSWGLPFRRGFFEIPARDFDLIRKGMIKD